MRMTHSDDMIGEPKAVRKSAFAKLVGVSAGRVSQMITAGLPVEPDGRIDVARGKLWISANISPTRSAAQSDQSTLPFAAVPDASAERVRLLREQADAAALKNAALRRELVPAAEVEREWSAIMRRMRAAVLAIPSRMRQTLPHLTAHDVAAMDGELRRVLEDLANDE
jgi:phage terminase Nu1 subunit (DNA packaging protein)